MRMLALSLALFIAGCATTDPGVRVQRTFMKAAKSCIRKCEPRTELGLACVCEIRVKIKATKE